MRRRIFLSGALSAAALSALAACTSPTPTPTRTVTPGPVPTPTGTAVPEPSAFLRSAWGTDPYAFGSVSYLPVGATPQHRVDLAENVADRVFFAGEATATTNPGTLQGALASGIRVAGEISAIAPDGERIAVIGAGLAGATAARRLADAGYDVTVIEARERVGGRIDTRTGDDWPVPVELGALFYDSVDTADLVDGLDAAGVRREQIDASDRLAVAADGASVDLGSAGSDALEKATTWAADQPLDTSLGDALTGSGAPDPAKATVDDSINDEDRVVQALAGGPALRYGASLALSAWYGRGDASDADLAGSGAESSADDRTTPVSPSPDANADADSGTDTDAPDAPGSTVILGDFGSVVTDALADLDLYLKAVVTSVSYTDDGVSLRLGTGESLTADRVVVTVPVGVLKTDAIEFDPPLPFAHRTAVGALGMGTIDTVWFRFDERFWQTDAQRWSLVGTADLLTEWVNLEPLIGEPVLVALVGADAAIALEQLSDDDVRTSAMSSLAAFVAADDAD